MSRQVAHGGVCPGRERRCQCLRLAWSHVPDLRPTVATDVVRLADAVRLIARGAGRVTGYDHELVMDLAAVGHVERHRARSEIGRRWVQEHIALADSSGLWKRRAPG